MAKSFLRSVYDHSSFARRAWFLYRFVKRNRYYPNLKRPATYNEKVLARKRDPKNRLFSVCSDKIEVKSYVQERIASEIVIPNFFIGSTISVAQLKRIIVREGGCVLKANHNSGTVHILTSKHTDDQIFNAVEDTRNQLEVDFGFRAGEPWYSKISPRILVEKRLQPEGDETSLRDYKMHVFRQNDGTQKLLLAVDFDRGSNHNRSFFDEEFNWLNIKTHVPSVRTVIDKPARFAEMCRIAKKLAEPFTYARVDLYSVDGNIYFGELTFAPGAGYLDDFQSRSYDLWMGNLWHGDPRY